MFNPKQLDELTEKLMGIVPQGVKDLQKDVEKNMRAVLLGAFNKMDLVTREEFDIQSAVLLRTRTKLEELERKVAELEQQLTPPHA